MRVRLSSGASGDDVVVNADPHTPVADVLQAIDHLSTTPGMHGSTPLGRSGLRDGAAVGGQPAALAVPEPGSPVMKVVGGPHAGQIFPLRLGSTVIGRGQPPFAIPDGAMSQRHVSVDLAADGTATVADVGSSNGTTLEGAMIRGPVPLPAGGLLWAGSSALSLGLVPRPDAVLDDGGDGTLRYNRPPHIRPSVRPAMVVFPGEVELLPRRDWPIAMAVVPLLAGGVLAFAFHQPQFLLFMILSPILLITGVVSDRRKGRRANRVRRREHAAAMEQATTELTAALRQETVARRADAPDAAELLLTARGPTSALWGRHRLDAAFLELRLGLAELPSHTEVRMGRGPAPGHRTLFAVPATVPLLAVGACGVAGPRDAVRGLARWLLVQAAVLHSPGDLRVVLLVPESGAATWAWARWLPHLRPDDAPSWSLIGNDAVTIGARIRELDVLVDRRLAAFRERGSDTVDRTLVVLVVLDGSRALRATPGLARLLQDGPQVGVVFLCLDEHEAQLPRECRAVVLVDAADPDTLLVRRDGHDAVADVAREQVATAYAETVARALAPLRDADPAIEEGSLPSEVRLLDQIGSGDPTPVEILAGWARHGRATAFNLGAASSGPFVLDLAAGPHMLVAGTTGSGKSGLLQTMIASLAVVNRPDAMNFLLVDYKGGAAFRDCSRLPHTVGVVTDLDGPATNRALTALRAELKRREHLMSRAGAADIAGYWARRDQSGREALEPLPRLLVCIDEFARLVHEVPEFVDGVVDVAAAGRSLGIHLVLATQHPAGVVSAAIKANTTIRVALRVADPTSSSDVVGVADAHALPPTPGRALVKIGSAAPVTIQTARIDGPRPGATARTPPPRVDRLGWRDLGREVPVVVTPAPPPGERTDLSDLVGAVCAANEQLGIPPQRSPWPPSLPVPLPLRSLQVTGPLVVPYGLEDLPEQQDQVPAVLDLAYGGHLLAGGGARSGRSTLLQTLAGSIAARIDPADVHIHAIDGGSALHSLAVLPHVGAVVPGYETERVDRLLGRLNTEIARRQQLIAASHASDLTEYRRTTGRAEPYLVLMIDGYDAVAAAVESVDGGRLLADLAAVLRDGPRAGLRAVLTGDRSTLIGRMGSTISDRVVLRLANAADYGMVGIPSRSAADDPPPGRGYRPVTGTALQVAVLGTEASGRAQAAGLADIAQRWGPPPASARPFHIDALPDLITSTDAAKLPLHPAGAPAFAGVGGDDLARIGIDVRPGEGAFLVLGGRRTGRSTALRVIAESLLASGHPVVLITPRPSPLAAIDHPGVRARLDGPACLTDEAPPDAVEGAVTLVDDLDVIADKPLGAALADRIRAGAGFVLAGSADGLGNATRGPALAAGRSGHGLVLCPSTPLPGAVFGAGQRLPRSMVGTMRPGRGALLADGHVVAVQVPLPAPPG